MARNEDLYEGIVRILQARPDAPVRVIVVDAGAGGAMLVDDTGAVQTGGDRTFRVKWNVQGHGVIAKVAVDDILKVEHKKAYQHLVALIEDDGEGREDIVELAQWPDRIKPPVQDPKLKKWGSLGQKHRADHYVNYAFDPEHPNAAPEPIGKGDILPALEEWSSELRNETDSTKRCNALAFIAHLIGDIHQPLHCTALTGEYFPRDEFDDGDQGGNLVWWNSTRTFHSLWDGLVITNPDKFDDSVNELREGLERDKFADKLDQNTTFEAWSLESFELSKKVYSEFFKDAKYIKKATRTSKGKSQTGQLFEAPSKKFRAWAREIAFQQGRIAAFRLADTLAELLADG